MWQLKLDGRRCISCGICMDVCAPRAIDMRVDRAARVEGAVRVHQFAGGGGEEPRPAAMMTFPYMAAGERCDGCEECIRQCPVDALRLTGESQAKRP